MEALGSGDERASFAVFYAAELAALVRFAMRHGATVHEAADAAQAAFVQAYCRWDAIDRPRAWLRKVTYREFLRGVRVRELSVEEPPETPGPLSPDAHVELDEETRSVYDCLARLPYTQRRVMSYHYDGFSHPEIATELGMTGEAVRQNVRRARKNLAELLKEGLDQKQETDHA